MQVIARDKDDVDARYDRALLYAEVNEPKKAVIALDGILKGRPGEPEVGPACNTVSIAEAAPAICVRQEDICFCLHRLPDHMFTGCIALSRLH